MLKLKTLLLLAASCCCVNAYCENNTLSVINKFWGKTPTQVSPKDFVGTITLLYATASQIDEEVKCAQTQVASDLKAVDINEYNDATTYSDPYYFVAEKPGTMKLTNNDGSDDDFVYVVYFNPKSRVAAYYECRPTDDSMDPFVNIVAINYNKSDEDTGLAVKAALDALKQLGLDHTATAVDTTCSTFNRKLN